MAMFGAKGDFLDPYRTPPIYGGPDEGIPSAPAVKPSFFGEGGTGRQIIGIVGDALSAAGGGQPVYAQAMQQQRLQDRQDRIYQQRQQDEQRQWMARELWKRANPEAQNPYRWEANDGSLMELGPDGQPRVAYKDPTPKINWITAKNDDGTMQVIGIGPDGRPIGSPPAAQPQRPQVGSVIADPRKGGASQSGSRTFP